MHFEGNTIPHFWYNNIRFENNKPDLAAIIILAEIVYWYRPTHIKDEVSGQTQSVKKRFAADMLQRSYKSFEEQFGLTKRQVRDAIARLENRGLVKRHFRTINSNGTPISNVLFIELNERNLEGVTFGRQEVSHSNVTGYDVETSEVVHTNVAPMTVEDKTYTEITTKITTKINNDNDDPKDPAYAEENPNPNPKPITAFQFYEQNGFGALASHVAYKVGNWIDDLSEELVIHAMKLSVENNVLRWNYVEKILKDWSNKKFTSIADVEADRLRFEAQKNQKQNSSFRGQPKGRQEKVPEWFNDRNNDNAQAAPVADPLSQDQQQIFEAKRREVLERLGKNTKD